MAIDKSFLRETVERYGFMLDEKQADDFSEYAQLLIDWNTRVNLTAITESKEIVQKHFLDSILLLDAIDLPINATMIDVGTGAGFPSIPCNIMRRDLQVTMLDSLNKRVNFLEAVTEKLDLRSSCVHERAEIAGKSEDFREKYYISTARAVANLSTLAEYCLPFVEVGGVFVALKGSEIEAELSTSRDAIALLGGEISGKKEYILPDGSVRNIVLVKKISQTPTKYPRNSARIKKSPI